MYFLKNGRLDIVVADPLQVQKITSRFDPTCFVEEVILDGRIHFAASEPHNRNVPSSGGRGLCSEFLFEGPTEAENGEWTPKLGVGLLRKKGEIFSPFQRHEKDPYENQCLEYMPDRIKFVTRAKECMGYAAETSRELQVSGNTLEMTVRLKNTGCRKLIFREYCHNFLSIDGLALGPDYELELPSVRRLMENVLAGPDFQGTGSPALYEVEGQRIRPRFYNPGPAVFDFGRGDIDDCTPFVWKLRHRGVKAAVTGRECFRPSAGCVWSCDHMICPEISYGASVNPGEEVVWKRCWSFEMEERIE